MQQVVKLILGIAFLLLAFPVGNFLAKVTKEELKAGRKWFNLIIGLCLIGIIVSLVFMNDILLFTFAFIALVTSRSLR